MKKLFFTLGIFLTLGVNVFANTSPGWIKSMPASSENPQAISTDVIQNNTALDLMLQNYRDGKVSITLVSTEEIDVGAGGVMVSNSGGSTRLMLANTSVTAVSPTMIDTGSISASTTYYLYAYATSVTATTFSVIFSASSSAPTGITYYQRLGSFKTDSSSNFVSVTNDINPQVGLGTMVPTYSLATPYQAFTDGFVVASYSATTVNSVDYLTGYTDSNTSPTTPNGNAEAAYYNNQDAPRISSMTMPVKKGNYWKVVNTTSQGGGNSGNAYIHWIPLGN